MRTERSTVPTEGYIEASQESMQDNAVHRRRLGMLAGAGLAGAHPAVTIVFTAFAVILTMATTNPVFLASSLILAIAFRLALRGPSGMRAVLGLIVLGSAIAVANPFFSTGGETVLFHYLGGRPYTAEALCNGAAIGMMVMAMMVWLFDMDDVLGSDRVLAMGGRVAPATSMLLSTTMRMLPLQRRRLERIGDARKAIGLSPRSGSLRDRFGNGVALAGASMDPLFEDAAAMADSMKARGYGLKGRTSYGSLSFGTRDAAVLMIICILGAATIVCAVLGGMSSSYYPVVSFAHSEAVFWTGISVYWALLSVPIALEAIAAIGWAASLHRMGG